MISEMKSSNELNEVFWSVLSIKRDLTGDGRCWSYTYISQWEELYYEAFERKPHYYVFSSFTTFLYFIYFCFFLLNQVIGITGPEIILSIRRLTSSNVALQCTT